MEGIKECLERELPDGGEAATRRGEFPGKHGRRWRITAWALDSPEEVGGTPCDMLTLAMANLTISRYGGPCGQFLLDGNSDYV